jgi:hypothetical protein
VSIHTAASSESIFSSAHVMLDIYSADSECHAKYAGTVKLDKPSVAIGIPADRWSYLVFDFVSSSFLAGRHGDMSYELPFKPQANHRYEIEVTYRDEIYNVVLGERQPDGTLRELPGPPAHPCAGTFGNISEVTARHTARRLARLPTACRRTSTADAR